MTFLETLYFLVKIEVMFTVNFVVVHNYLKVFYNCNSWWWPCKAKICCFLVLNSSKFELWLMVSLFLFYIRLWGHPHSITTLFPIQSSVTHHSSLFSPEHPSSHPHTRRLLKPSSSTLLLPPSLSCWHNGSRQTGPSSTSHACRLGGLTMADQACGEQPE